MTTVELGIALDIAGIALTLGIIIGAVPLLKKGKNPLTVALFIFSMVSLSLSFAYWLTYSLIRPDMRMPIAANEIGEIAYFLLLAAVLENVFRKGQISAKKETVFTAVFAAASVALWIAWSGEWIQDIIYGLAFGYFLCTCVRSLKQTDALSRGRWCILGTACAAIIIAQFTTLFAPEGLKQPLDYLCYGLMFASLIWLFVKSIITVKRNKDTRSPLALSFTLCGFAHSTLFMSSEWFYMAALSICLAELPLMFIALRREVTA